jgi:hypothetical protein
MEEADQIMVPIQDHGNRTDMYALDEISNNIITRRAVQLSSPSDQTLVTDIPIILDSSSAESIRNGFNSLVVYHPNLPAMNLHQIANRNITTDVHINLAEDVLIQSSRTVVEITGRLNTGFDNMFTHQRTLQGLERNLLLESNWWHHVHHPPANTYGSQNWVELFINMGNDFSAWFLRSFDETIFVTLPMYIFLGMTYILLASFVPHNIWTRSRNGMISLFSLLRIDAARASNFLMNIPRALASVDAFRNAFARISERIVPDVRQNYRQGISSVRSRFRQRNYALFWASLMAITGVLTSTFSDVASVRGFLETARRFFPVNRAGALLRDIKFELAKVLEEMIEYLRK